MRIAWNNCFSIKDADIVLFGVPDSSGSMYKGSAQAPNDIRQASMKWETGCYSNGEEFYFLPQSALNGKMKKKVFDAGNILREDLPRFTESVSKAKKLLGMIGGDHYLTFEAIKGLAKKHKQLSLVCFDAHLDFVSSERKFYGSVLTELREKKLVNFKKSSVIGARAFTAEELVNAKKAGLKIVSMNELKEKSPKKVLSAVKRRLGKKVYLSIDIDCVEPAFAPGVSDPIPGGLTPAELFFMARSFVDKKLVGFDVMEVNPLEDFKDLTTHLAAKLIAELIA